MAWDNTGFINPYTFIPLKEGGKKLYEDIDENKLTGKITCRILTRTKLAIPDVSTEEDSGISKYPFYRVNQKAVIPGSSIRGVIRNVYETLTQSCMRINDSDDDYFTSRVNKEFPGLIEKKNGIYYLYKAKRFRDKSDVESNFKTGDRVEFEKKDGSGRATGIAEHIALNSNEKGYYLRVYKFKNGENHNHPSVFTANAESAAVIDKVYIDRLKKNVDMYKPNDDNTDYETESHIKDNYKSCIRKMENGETMLPVWYFHDNGNYYFAPSQMSRAVFVKKPKDFLVDMGYATCTDTAKMCEGCALFGMVGKDCQASHLRFSDAVCEDEDCFDRYYVLPILANPHLSSFEFYLRNTKGKNAYGADTDGVILAGRKYYWHHADNKINCDNEKALEHKEMASKMELVKSGSVFTFDIYFDKITKDQLRKLVFTINLGGNKEDSKLCHKIGHGKPIGLGSVKIVVDKVVERRFDNSVYTVDDITEEIIEQSSVKNMNLLNKEICDNVRTICNMGEKAINSDKIMYPCTRKDGDIFEWFSENRKTLKSKGYIPYKQLLPEIEKDKNNKLCSQTIMFVSNENESKQKLPMKHQKDNNYKSNR